jgi:hypothetical protein
MGMQIDRAEISSCRSPLACSKNLCRHESDVEIYIGARSVQIRTHWMLDALTVSVIVDNSTDMLSSRPPHIALELQVLISAGMQELTGEGLGSAHHGLSPAVTARLGAQERTVLFDAGPDPYAR